MSSSTDKGKSSHEQVAEIKIPLKAVNSDFLTCIAKYESWKRRSEKNFAPVFERTQGAHVFNLWSHTLIVDLLRDLICLMYNDNNKGCSLKGVFKLLKKKPLMKFFRNKYGKAGVEDSIESSRNAFSDGEGFSEGKLKTMAKIQEKEQKEKFDNLYETFDVGCQELFESELFKNLKSARNKIMAHRDQTSVSGEPRVFTFSDFEICWGTAEEYMSKVRPLIEMAGVLICGINYNYESYDEVWQNNADDFTRILLNLNSDNLETGNKKRFQSHYTPPLL